MSFSAKARVIRVIDADTLRVDLFLAPGLTQRTSVRLVGIDTPEKGWCK